MPRKLLLFAALAVVGTTFVLWLVTRDHKTAESSPDDTQLASRDDSHASRRPRPSLGDSNPTTTSDPSRPNASTVTQVERGTNGDKVTEPPLEYTLPDGRKVRDFRDPANRKPLDVPPSIHPPGGRKIRPELTGKFTDAVMAASHECGKAVGKEVLGDKPRVEGQIVISIKGAQANVTGAVFKVTNFNSESVAETTRQCIEQKALDVKVPAPGEDDLESYSINLSLSFR